MEATRKVTLKEGCPGCGQKWRDPGAEGQCSRCKRCLECCGHADVRYSCTEKETRKNTRNGVYLPSPRSEAAYQRWLSNPKILGHNRRIV